MYNIFKNIIKFAKKEKRLCVAGIFVIIIFFLNQLLFSSQKIISEDCLDGDCGVQEIEKPQLSQEENIFYQDDILTDIPSGYYRLTFQSKSDKQENIAVKLNTYTEVNKEIDKLSLKASEKFQNQEVFFFLPKGFDNIIFEKETPGGTGNIFIKGIGITKLNISSQEEFASMQKTVVAQTNFSSSSKGQTQIFSDSFSMLQDSDTRLGQIFKAEDNYISGVSFKVDIIRDRTIKDKNYKIVLQEIKCMGNGCQLIGNNVSGISFSVKDALEKYQQEDGTFLFPLYANVEKGKSYFVGIDNSSVKVSRKNYLDLKGGKSDDTYVDGSAGIRVGKKIYKIAGDLFFAIRGVDFDYSDGMRLLNGAKIESLGKWRGKYTYVAKGEFIDITDLWSASLGTNFNDSRGVIVGRVEDNSALIYRVNTIYPIQKIHFFAQQTKTSWKKVKVEYSFDKESWIEAPSLEKTEQELLSINAANNQDNNSNENDSNYGDSNILTEGATETEDGRMIYFRTTSDLEDLDNMEYSFDQENWNKTSIFNKINIGDTKKSQVYIVDSSALIDDDNFFVEKENVKDKIQVFDFDVTALKNEKTIYFRITPDFTDNSKTRYFSIKNLQITADLEIK